MSTPEEISEKTSKTDPTLMRPHGDPDRRIDEEPEPDAAERPAVGAEMEDSGAADLVEGEENDAEET